MIRRPFSARVKANHRRVHSPILANVCAVAMAMGPVNHKAQKMVSVYLKKIQSLEFQEIV